MDTVATLATVVSVDVIDLELDFIEWVKVGRILADTFNARGFDPKTVDKHGFAPLPERIMLHFKGEEGAAVPPAFDIAPTFRHAWDRTCLSVIDFRKIEAERPVDTTLRVWIDKDGLITGVFKEDLDLWLERMQSIDP